MLPASMAGQYRRHAPPFPNRAIALSMGGTSTAVDTRICPHCHQPTRVGWPMCDGCARTLPAYRPLPDLRLVAELERWDRANPRPLDGAAAHAADAEVAVGGGRRLLCP